VPHSLLAWAWAAAILLALLFGSFLNVCISRLPRHHSIVWPGSHCPLCLAPIRPWHNLPVLSWLLLRGRCRDCRRAIPVRYLLVESGYAALVAASIAFFGFTPQALAAAVFCFLTLGLLVMDYETMLLPDAFTLPGLALGLLWSLAAPVMAGDAGIPLDASPAGSALVRLEKAALAAAGWALLLLTIRWGYCAVRRRQGLGLGDVKLAEMLAAWLGTSRTAVCFLLAVVAAALFGLTALGGQAFLRAQPQREQPNPDLPAAWGTMRLPLGTFLCAGGFYALFFGDKTLQWYFSLWP